MIKRNKKKVGIGRIIENNAYMLGFIVKAAPGYLFVETIRYIWGALYAFLINTFLYQYVLNAVQEGRHISEMIPVLLFVFVFTITFHIFCFVDFSP